MNLQIQTENLANTSAEMRLVINDLHRIMEDIEMLILSVGGSWQGDAERAFAEKILYVKKQFGHIATFFDDYGELLKIFAYEYEQQEADLASKINMA